MIALLQRVSRASVFIDGQTTARIGCGLCVLVGIESVEQGAAGERIAARLAERICGYRVFPDEAGRMNRSLSDVGGELLLVPNFTLAADTASGMRAGFSSAAAPEQAEPLFEALRAACSERLGREISSGSFGTDMQVELVNDGPVTFTLSCNHP